MPNYTPNLNLEKPLQTEMYNIDVHNANSDAIDTAYKEQVDAIQEHKTKTPLDHPDGSVTEPKLAPNSVSTRTIAPKSVTGEKLTDSGVIPGTYTKVTVDRTGRVTNGGDISVFQGATSGANGTAGLVPAPSKAEVGKVLGANGQWITPYSHPVSSVTPGTYRNVTVNNQGHVTGGNNPTLPINAGGTGATTADNALANLGISGAITGLSVNGRTITYTKKDGSTGTITTQDTSNGIIAQSLGTNGYVKFANGLIIQWGTVNSGATFTFPIAFSSAVYSIIKTPKHNTNNNQYLMKEACVGSPSLTGVAMPSTSPALTFYVIAIGY